MKTLCDPVNQPSRFLCPWDSPVLENGSGSPCPPPGDLPNSGIEHASLKSPALAAGFFTTSTGGYSGKENTCNAREIRDVGLIRGSERFHWRRKWQPTPVFLPGESHGEMSLGGHHPQCYKYLDVTEVTKQAHMHIYY